MSLLTEQEIYQMYSEPCSDAEMVEFARAIEAKVIEKIKAQGPVAWVNLRGDYVELSHSWTVYGSHTIPLYKLPEGD